MWSRRRDLRPSRGAAGSGRVLAGWPTEPGDSVIVRPIPFLDGRLTRRRAQLRGL